MSICPKNSYLFHWHSLVYWFLVGVIAKIQKKCNPCNIFIMVNILVCFLSV